MEVNDSTRRSHARLLSVLLTVGATPALTASTCGDDEEPKQAAIVQAQPDGGTLGCPGRERPACADGQSLRSESATAPLTCAPCGEGIALPPNDPICFGGRREFPLACLPGRVHVVRNGALTCEACSSPGGDAGADSGDSGVDGGGEALCAGCTNSPPCPAKPPVANADCPLPDAQCHYCVAGDKTNASRFVCTGTWKRTTVACP